MFLRSTWAFECIRTQEIPVFEIHAHPFVSWEKLFSGGTSLCYDATLLQSDPKVDIECDPKVVPPKVHDLTNSPPQGNDTNRKAKRLFRPYDGDKDSQDRETVLPLFSPTKVGDMTIYFSKYFVSQDLLVSGVGKRAPPNLREEKVLRRIRINILLQY